MPDMILQHVDSLLTERIRALARERQCTINDVMLHALRTGLGFSAAHGFSESLRAPEALAVLEGQWEAAEQGAFQEALRALALTSPTQLAPERIRYGEPAAGAE